VRPAYDILPINGVAKVALGSWRRQILQRVNARPLGCVVQKALSGKNQVVLLKMNPVNDYLTEPLQAA